MPPTLSRLFAALTLMALAGMPAAAQQRDSVPGVARTSAPRGRFTPPLTPKRAFILSAALPGVGQSRLDRGTSGALFASVELAAMVMVRRSQLDLREARRYQVDTLPAQYVLSGNTFVKNGVFTNRYTGDLVRTRRLHVEDWLAVLGFNHLFAGADAFVAAQLWDVPVQLSAVPLPTGALFVATIHF